MGKRAASILLFVALGLMALTLARAEEATTAEGDFFFPASEGYEYYPTTDTHTPDHVVTGEFLLDYDLTVRSDDPDKSAIVFVRAWEEGTPEEDARWVETRDFDLSEGEDQHLEIMVYRDDEEDDNGRFIKFICDFGAAKHEAGTVYVLRDDSAPVHISLGATNATLANVQSTYTTGSPTTAVEGTRNSWGLNRLFSILVPLGKALILLLVECLIVFLAMRAGMDSSRGAIICCVLSLLIFGLSVAYLYASFAPNGLEAVNEMVSKVSRLIGEECHLGLVPDDSVFHLPVLIAAGVGAVVSAIVFFVVCTPDNKLLGLVLLPLGAYVQVAAVAGFIYYVLAYVIIIVGWKYFSMILTAFGGGGSTSGYGGYDGGSAGVPGGLNDYTTGESYSVWSTSQMAGGTYAKLRDSSGNLVDARQDSNGTWYRLDNGAPLDEL